MPLPQQYQWQNDGSNGANSDDDATDAEWLGGVLNADVNDAESGSSAARHDTTGDIITPLPSPLPTSGFSM
jgi:hypothetical protein